MRISTSLLVALGAAASLTTASPSFRRSQGTNDSPLSRVKMHEFPGDHPRESTKVARTLPYGQELAMKAFKAAMLVNDKVATCQAAAWLLYQQGQWSMVLWRYWHDVECERQYHLNPFNLQHNRAVDPNRRDTTSNSSSTTAKPTHAEVQAMIDALRLATESRNVVAMCQAAANVQHILGAITSVEAEDYSRDCLQIPSMMKETDAKYSLSGLFPESKEQAKELVNEYCGNYDEFCEGKQDTPFCASLRMACDNRHD